jgi:transcriptional regulator with XRE-family HTH domain
MQKNLFYECVGRNIREKREERGLTQQELAFKSDLHRAYIGQVERGEKKIGTFNLFKISQVLGVDINSLIPSDIF